MEINLETAGMFSRFCLIIYAETGKKGRCWSGFVAERGAQACIFRSRDALSLDLFYRTHLDKAFTLK